MFHINSKGSVLSCKALQHSCRYSAQDHFSLKTNADREIAYRKQAGYTRLATTKKDLQLYPAKTSLRNQIKTATSYDDVLQTGALFFHLLNKILPFSLDQRVAAPKELALIETYISYLYHQITPAKAFLPNKVIGPFSREIRSQVLPIPNSLKRRLKNITIHTRYANKETPCYSDTSPFLHSAPNDLTANTVMNTAYQGEAYSNKRKLTYWLGDLGTDYFKKVGNKAKVRFTDGTLLIDQPIFLISPPIIQAGHTIAMANKGYQEIKNADFLHGYVHIVQEKLVLGVEDVFDSFARERVFSNELKKPIFHGFPVAKLGVSREEFFPHAVESVFFPKKPGNGGFYEVFEDRTLLFWTIGMWLSLGSITYPRAE